MFSWGSNSHGQLGIGSTIDKHMPSEVPFVQTPSFISGGGTFSIFAEGTCDCLFVNHLGRTIWIAGQLKPKELATQRATFQVLGEIEEGISALACGWDFILVLSQSGKLYFGGHNTPGFLLKDMPITKWLDGLASVTNVPPIQHIAAGLCHAVVISGMFCPIPFNSIKDIGSILQWTGNQLRDVDLALGNQTSERVIGCAAGACHAIVWTGKRLSLVYVC
uniref:Secretion-regulating guanine nucleotide exchange factor n=1 Tax=Mesocestoides corti TaxID=53468 RepID=A0A5K3F9U6_MESCO